MTSLTIAVRGHDFNVLPTPRYARFWRNCAQGLWEPGTFEVLDQHVRPNGYLIDIGAWIGPITLYAAARGSRVTAFEPDLRSLAEIRANVDLNPSLRHLIQIEPYALAATTSIAELYGKGLGRSGTTLSPAILQNGEIFYLNSLAICKTLDVLLASETYRFRCANLIKIDVEGAEYEIIPRLARFLGDSYVPILISFHPQKVPRMDLKEGTSRVLSALSSYRAYIVGEELAPVADDQIISMTCTGEIREHVLFFSRNF